MAVLKAKEARKLNEEELKKRLEDLKKELMKLKSQVSGGSQAENPGRMRAIKRTIARLLTIKKEKEVETKKNG
ncbi:MAG: 50S ribosomal protein L29 [Candidatus Woesearchaeota archaeon]|nr:MAG: 50S ribosomal protein L29 [Candidatus Woesearchaeota archaeon]